MSANEFTHLGSGEMSRTVAIDLGAARCGVAIDDELGLYAHPRPNFSGRNRKELLVALAEFAKAEHVGRFIVGLPVDMRGTEGAAARSARVFAQELADVARIPVELWDERLSTTEASRQLTAIGIPAKKQKDRIDGAAAATILQSYLDAHRPKVAP